MHVRPATHAGVWYTGNAMKLSAQIDGYHKQLDGEGRLDGIGDGVRPIKGARVLIGPHAGYAYSGARLAETFSVWDTSKVKRVFILGPSHHVYFKNSVKVSGYDFYETPFGNLPVDQEVTRALVGKLRSSGKGSAFTFMTEEVDDDEHSFEMHAPFIYYKTKNLPQGVPKIVPLMISGMDDALCQEIADSLLPYLRDPETTIVISSDFCHWGSRFGYTEYLKQVPRGIVTRQDLVTLRSSSKLDFTSIPIHESIRLLDRHAMDVAASGSYDAWRKYISTTQNTICGQKPIGVILKSLEAVKAANPATVAGNLGFNWINYSQSGKVHSYTGSSVSYASGYVVLD